MGKFTQKQKTSIKQIFKTKQNPQQMKKKKTKILDQPFDLELCQTKQKEQLIILDVKIYLVQEKVINPYKGFYV